MLSFISPSFISVFRDVSKLFRVKPLMQHLKRPPFLLHDLAKLDCSWKIEFLNFRWWIWTYVACTLSDALCGVPLYCGVALPRKGTDVRKSKALLPSFFGALCKVLKHLGVHPIKEIFVILEVVNIFQFCVTRGLSVVVHLIGLPFCRVLVTVGNQAAVIPILVHVLHTVKQLTCCNTIRLIWSSDQLQKWHS